MTTATEDDVRVPSTRARPLWRGSSKQRWSSRGRIVGMLSVVAVAQVALALRPGTNPNAFSDEGLYLFMGHRMMDHFATGQTLFENPGSYFSGAPGFYPVLAALFDSAGGLAAARLLSLMSAISAMVATYGIGRELFGRRAGLLGAAAFAVSGSVVFQSHLATYDCLAMALFSMAAWLVLASVRRDQLLGGPVGAALLAAAFFAKYATAVFLPVVAALAVAAAWPTRHRWTVLMRTVGMFITAAVLIWVVLAFWGASMTPGIVDTTANRNVLAPAPPAALAHSAWNWVAPWLVLALGAVVFRRRSRVLAAVVLAAALAAPLEQIVIGESTSLAKHLAFSMVFACPLVGDATSRLIRHSPARSGTGIVAAIMVVLTIWGVRDADDFATGWVDDTALVASLRTDIANQPGKVILGEEPAAQRYALRQETDPQQWADTFVFFYDGLQGAPAYRRAIDQSHFGIIYLDLQTSNGRMIADYLSSVPTPYRLESLPPRILRDEVVGTWQVWVPTDDSRT